MYFLCSTIVVLAIVNIVDEFSAYMHTIHHSLTRTQNAAACTAQVSPTGILVLKIA